MALTRVTITGADDAVRPSDLLALSREFPFVEWGILFSWKRSGDPRYPSNAWRERLQDALPDAQSDWPALSAHFCGNLARTVLAGKLEPLEVLSGEYRRVQLNGWVGFLPELPELLQRFSEEFILQVRAEDFLPVASAEAGRAKSGNVSALWDCSGGRGVEPFSWPRAPLGLRLGYAGGITPDNVLDVLRAIGPASHDFWVDMESGVRTDDRFDLDKVLAVLNATAPLVQVSGIKNGDRARQ